MIPTLKAFLVLGRSFCQGSGRHRRADNAIDRARGRAVLIGIQGSYSVPYFLPHLAMPGAMGYGVRPACSRHGPAAGIG